MRTDLIYIPDEGSGAASLLKKNVPDRGISAHKIRVSTVDNIAAEINAPIKLIKLDLEGPELGALKGASVLLARAHKPHILFETDPELYATADEQHKIAALLLGAGYRLVDIITNSTWRPPSRKADVLAVPVEPH
jgi:Methyltransferase FkbM domain